MPVFKSIGGGDYTVEPYTVHASQSISWTSGSGGNPTGFSVNYAEDPGATYPGGTDNMGIQNTSGIYSYPLYKSVYHYFYDQSGSISEMFDYVPDSSCWVLSIGSNLFGEYIKPGSFRMDMQAESNFISDDSRGNLLINGDSTVVGTIFYNHGLIVLKDSGGGVSEIQSTGVDFVSATEIDVIFQSTVTIYEHTVVCSIEPNEFRTTINPSAFDENENGDAYYRQILSGSASPYVTTIGLYNDFNECLAIAKVSIPIVRQNYTDQTFIVTFDE